MIHLARTSDDRYVPVREISSALEVSHAFLAKILQQLVAEELLLSLRGPNGGVKLARSASEIVLNDVVVAIDGHKMFDACVLGLPGCGVRVPCPMHESWGAVRTRFLQMMEENTLADVASKTQPFGLRTGSA